MKKISIFWFMAAVLTIFLVAGDSFASEDELSRASPSLPFEVPGFAATGTERALPFNLDGLSFAETNSSPSFNLSFLPLEDNSGVSFSLATPQGVSIDLGSLSLAGNANLIIPFQGFLSGDVQLSVRAADTTVSLGFLGIGKADWQGKISLRGEGDEGFQEIWASINPQGLIDLGVNARLTLGSFCTAEYSLDNSGDYSLNLSGVREEVKNGAYAIADELMSASKNNDKNQGTGSDSDSLKIAEGWFLKLTPGEQKAAIEIIKDRLSVELSAEGWNLSDVKLVLGLGEATDENNNPKTLVAFSIKINQSGSSDKVDLKESGGSSENAVLSATVMDVSDGRGLGLAYGLDGGFSLGIKGDDSEIAFSSEGLSISSTDGVTTVSAANIGGLSPSLGLSTSLSAAARVEFNVSSVGLQIGFRRDGSGIAFCFSQDGITTSASWQVGNVGCLFAFAPDGGWRLQFSTDREEDKNSDNTSNSKN